MTIDRDRLVDAACVLVALAAGAATFATSHTTMPEWMRWADLTAGLLGCLALWWRRRWPVGISVALLPIAAFSAMLGIATAIAIFTVAVNRRPSVTLVVGGLHVAVIPAYIAFHPDPESPYWVSVVVVVLAHFALMAWGMYVRVRRQLLESLRERAEQAEADQHQRLRHARHLERERIARDMHDALGHRLSLLSLHAGALSYRPDAPAHEIARSAEAIRVSAHDALEDLRAVIGVLRGTDDEAGAEHPQRDLEHLEPLVAESRQAGMRVRLHDKITDPTRVPPPVGRSAYRIAQEGLTNARKHAAGAVVDVTVRGAPGGGLTVEVRNPVPDGTARSEIPGAGAGLVGLAERASLAGGTLEHGRTADGDFRLWAWLPWPS